MAGRRCATTRRRGDAGTRRPPPSGAGGRRQPADSGGGDTPVAARPKAAAKDTGGQAASGTRRKPAESIRTSSHAGRFVDVGVHVDPGGVRISRTEVKRLAALVFTSEKPRRGWVHVNFIGDDLMSGLHLRYHDDPNPTDILTFDYSDGPAADLHGELYIDVDHARRAAAEHGTDLRRELLLYVVHGLLHLAGYDDKTPRGFRRMHAREDELLEAFGVGAVFRPSAGTASPKRKRGR